jgi:serine/threonine protein phosphatase PrpC
MSAQLTFGAATDVGKVRDNNEDCYLARPDLGLWLIADGMGGHDAGEVAASIVRDFVCEAVANGKPLKTAIALAHHAVKHAASNNIGSPGMGTTVVALRIHGIQYEIAWVGDSRAYVWADGKLSQLSTDHSYVQSLVDSGAITREEMATHAQRNVITQSLGVSTLDDIVVDSVSGTLPPGAKILLCSDGLTDFVGDDEIARILSRSYDDDQTQVDMLIARALANGGGDNITVELISAPRQHTILDRIQRMLLNTPLAPLVANAREKRLLYALMMVLLGVSMVAIWQYR